MGQDKNKAKTVFLSRATKLVVETELELGHRFWKGNFYEPPEIIEIPELGPVVAFRSDWGLVVRIGLPLKSGEFKRVFVGYRSSYMGKIITQSTVYKILEFIWDTRDILQKRSRTIDCQHYNL